ncbi:Conserved hypothetical protein [Candidatus Protochlamydia naegleriophila]|uniref:Uncharacterized protein n=1 Tax=Candidatus Protochlamydia naegleriophila TaxID=389348 RepID=A0A0U5JB18_9BACT|nr:hypothetical protein [Candidatus Protochlamydia naegleriophila]CUI16010.1 Conserved hypothetical protein [Candidatus Protochlamydia naegleriophila]
MNKQIFASILFFGMFTFCEATPNTSPLPAHLSLAPINKIDEENIDYLFPVESNLASNPSLQAIFPEIKSNFDGNKILNDLKKNGFYDKSSNMNTISDAIDKYGFYIIRSEFNEQLNVINSFFDRMGTFPKLSFSDKPYENKSDLNNERHFMCDNIAFYFSIKDGVLLPYNLSTKNFKSKRPYFYSDLEGSLEDYLDKAELSAISEILEVVRTSISEYKKEDLELSGKIFLAKEPGTAYRGTNRVEGVKISWHQDRIEEVGKPLNTSEFLLTLVVESNRGAANGLTGGNLLIGSLNEDVGTEERRRAVYELDFRDVSVGAVIPIESGYGYLIEQNRNADKKGNPRVHCHTLGVFELNNENIDAKRNVIICQINTNKRQS